jgi:molybdate transport system substrate-binding protein
LSTCRCAALLVALVLALHPGAAVAQTVTVFAASSLTDSLKAVATAYKTRTGTAVTLVFNASSILARQIEQGAPADIFFSADTDWMDYLQKRGRISDGTRTGLLGNQLVLIAATDAAPVPKIASHFALARMLGNRKLAMADPATVPAGKYGKAALITLGVWDSVRDKVVPAENVRVALEYVARGEAAYGIVYATDARITPAVRLAGTFPQTAYPAIIYPVALTKDALPAAKDFLRFLSSSDARAIFEKAGFMVRGRARNGPMLHPVSPAR